MLAISQIKAEGDTGEPCAPLNVCISEIEKTGGSMMDFLQEAARVTQPGGKTVINGTARSPFFNSIPSTQQLEALGLSIKYQSALLPEFQGMEFVTTGGRTIDLSKMNTIIFIKR